MWSPVGGIFEFNNDFYPDVDDTGEVLLALRAVQTPRERYQHEVTQRAIAWVFAMQCKNGGWAAFDKDNTKTIFQYIPFADHNAMLDPPTVDITGRILGDARSLWVYAARPAGRSCGAVCAEGAGARRQLVWALGRELPVRHVPGAARPGGDGLLEPRARGAERGRVDRMVQNADGGWGETCGSL